MKIIGIETMSPDQIQWEVQRGGKFVVFQYTISIIVMTFRRGSDIYFIKAGEGTGSKGLPFTLMSLLLGWWGFPWGPIFTIGSLITNFSGGKNVTANVLPFLLQQAGSTVGSVPANIGDFIV